MAMGFWSPKVVYEYRKRIDTAISIAKIEINKGRANSYTYFYLGGALGFKGRLKLMEQRWFSSYMIAVQAINALKTCKELNPGNKDVLLGLGMYDYYSVRFSGVLKFLARIFLHKGDKERGLKELHIAADEATFSSIEAKSLLLYIYLFLENDYSRARPLADELADMFLNYPGHIHNKGITYILLEMEAEYQKTLNYLQKKAAQQISQLKTSEWKRRGLYLEASYWLFNEKYDKAREKLEAILSNPDPENDPYMIAWPQLKIGMSYELEGNKEKAVKYYKLITQMENGAGAQFLAEKHISDPIEKESPFLLF
ncbi:tetratricopeptide repeat protein [Thermodesulfobacteriota bacterium]